MSVLYIHIPFCRTRCAYCDFYSTTREAELPRYADALCREIEERRCELPHTRITSIYIGGGTPSLLSPTLLNRILDTIYAHYDIDADAEVTVEVNPDDIVRLSTSPDDNGLAALLRPRGKAGGAINRISLGIQSFDDGLLRLIRRRHDAATAIRAVQALQAMGIDNISIDLIYGLPSQTIEQWEHDLDIAFSLNIQHLSAYALSYEPGTALTRWREEGRITEVSDELSVAMFRRLCQRASKAGFEHYEISNFCRPGYHSRHNSSYWTAIPYLGFGPAAHSYDGQRTRRANTPSLDAYLSAWLDANSSPAPYTTETLTDDELYDEAVMCGLRTAAGIDLTAFGRRFGQPCLDALLREAAPHIVAHRLLLLPENAKPHTHLRIAEPSWMVADDIMSDLMTS